MDVAKILPILGLVGRLFLVVFLIAFIAGVGYTFYYYNMPMDKPRPIDLEMLFHDVSSKVKLPAKAAPGPTVLPTESIMPPAGESTPPAETPTAGGEALALPNYFG